MTVTSPTRIRPISGSAITRIVRARTSTTARAAYAQLTERGILELRQGSGTRVAGAASGERAARRPGRGIGLFEAIPCAIDLLRAVPSIPPPAIDIVRNHTPAIDPVALAETAPAGLPVLRERIARLMCDEGTATTREQILVVHGGQQGLALLVDELISPGYAVITESITWPGVDVQPAARRILAVDQDSVGIGLRFCPGRRNLRCVRRGRQRVPRLGCGR